MISSLSNPKKESQCIGPSLSFLSFRLPDKGTECINYEYDTTKDRRIVQDGWNHRDNPRWKEPFGRSRDVVGTGQTETWVCRELVRALREPGHTRHLLKGTNREETVNQGFDSDTFNLFRLGNVNRCKRGRIEAERKSTCREDLGPGVTRTVPWSG